METSGAASRSRHAQKSGSPRVWDHEIQAWHAADHASSILGSSDLLIMDHGSSGATSTAPMSGRAMSQTQPAGSLPSYTATQRITLRSTTHSKPRASHITQRHASLLLLCHSHDKSKVALALFAPLQAPSVPRHGAVENGPGPGRALILSH